MSTVGQQLLCVGLCALMLATIVAQEKTRN